MEKLPCKECGALILPATAKSNGGLCTPCKQGTRRSIEEARVRNQAQKAYDPYRELWISLVRRSEDATLKGFSKAEITYFAVLLLEGEVYNGGFEQYFSNSSGDYYREALSGLNELNAPHSARILREAAEALFDGDDPPENQPARWAAMADKHHYNESDLLNLSPALSERLDALDKRFCEDSESLGALLIAYAERHWLIDPFKA